MKHKTVDFGDVPWAGSVGVASESAHGESEWVEDGVRLACVQRIPLRVDLRYVVTGFPDADP